MKCYIFTLEQKFVERQRLIIDHSLELGLIITFICLSKRFEFSETLPNNELYIFARDIYVVPPILYKNR